LVRLVDLVSPSRGVRQSFSPPHSLMMPHAAINRSPPLFLRMVLQELFFFAPRPPLPLSPACLFIVEGHSHCFLLTGLSPSCFSVTCPLSPDDNGFYISYARWPCSTTYASKGRFPFCFSSSSPRSQIEGFPRLFSFFREGKFPPSVYFSILLPPLRTLCSHLGLFVPFAPLLSL